MTANLTPQWTVKQHLAAQDFLTRAGFDETYRIVEYKRSLNGT
jgi:hypothetical protein